jgi:hypothetical protein
MLDDGGALVFHAEFERAFDELMIATLLDNPELLDDPELLNRVALAGIACAG